MRDWSCIYPVLEKSTRHAACLVVQCVASTSFRQLDVESHAVNPDPYRGGVSNFEASVAETLMGGLSRDSTQRCGRFRALRGFLLWVSIPSLSHSRRWRRRCRKIRLMQLGEIDTTSCNRLDMGFLNGDLQKRISLMLPGGVGAVRVNAGFLETTIVSSF